MMLAWLPPEQWHALDGTELGEVYQHLPATANVWVIEDDAKNIIACGAFFPMPHHEGLWIGEGHRHSKEVWKLIGQVLGTFSVTRPFITASASEVVARLLERAGAEKLPGQFWRCENLTTDLTKLKETP